MADDSQQVLVAVDGSKQSINVVRYVAGMCAPQRSVVTLLHILSPAGRRGDHDIMAAGADERIGLKNHLDQRRRVVDAFMDNMRQVLLSSGFPEGAVRVAVQPRQAGIVADIVHEARRGYRAVAAGNSGFNPITRLTMGSVVSKLVASLTDVPLWVVGGQPSPQKVLVCLDRSPAAADVIEHVGRMLAGRPLEITLLHIIRSPADDPFAGTEMTAADECDRYEYAAGKAVLPVFEMAADALERCGFPAERISVKIVSGTATRAGTIFAQAHQGGYGTIVAGRLGVEGQAEFPIGTVPMKLVQLVDDLAVWVVSGR